MELPAALPRGFLFSAVRAGIKPSGKPDVALAVFKSGANAAAMFTSNKVVAAPIIVGRRHLAHSGGSLRALVVNAGNATSESVFRPPGANRFVDSCCGQMSSSCAGCGLVAGKTGTDA